MTDLAAAKFIDLEAKQAPDSAWTIRHVSSQMLALM